VNATRQGALLPYGDLIPPWVLERARDFFAFGLNYLPLTLSTTQTQAFAVDGDADFLLTCISGFATSAAAPQTEQATIPALISISDTGSGRLFQNTPLHIENLIGSGQLPGFLPYPKLIPAASVVSVTLTSLDAAASWNIRLAFSGFKIFPFPENPPRGMRR